MNLTAEAIVGQHYAFAHGRLGVLRQSLLSKTDMDRLLGAHDLREVERILTELKFTAVIDQSLRTADAILNALAQWIRREAEEMVDTSKHHAFNILWIENDLPLLAYLLKRRAGLTSAISTEPETGVTAYDPAALRALVDQGEAKDLPPRLVGFVQSVRILVDPTPAQIDTLVARFGAEERLALARQVGSDLITRFVRHTIDAQNIRTALRLLQAHESDPASFLLDGGTIKPASLLGSVENVRRAIASSDFHFHLLKPLNDDLERPTALERGLSDVLADDIDRMWDRPLGVEPPFAFAATALSQLRVMRAAILGKRNMLSPQDIKQILPPFIHGSRFAA